MVTGCLSVQICDSIYCIINLRSITTPVQLQVGIKYAITQMLASFRDDWNGSHRSSPYTCKTEVKSLLKRARFLQGRYGEAPPMANADATVALPSVSTCGPALL